MAYASRTGTRRNLAALRAAGWGLLVTPAVPRTEGFDRFCVDNGAWSAFCQGTAWDPGAFSALVDAVGTGDFVVAPDIVAGGLASLALTESWLPRLPGLRLIAVQDGMTPADVRPLLGATVGIFVGGSTDWKLATLPAWGRLAKEAGCYLHVGRVNSKRRIYACAYVGADSFDGTSVSRYAVTLPKLDGARRQPSLFGGTGV